MGLTQSSPLEGSSRKGEAISTDPITREFMASAKVVQVGIQWSLSPHTETAKCTIPVFVPTRPGFTARLCLSAHVSRIPEKYTFALLLGSERVAALDVNPGRSHTNFRSAKRETVWDTHWQEWPDMDHAEIDSREMTHRKWMDVFAIRFGLKINGGYRKPLHYGGEQLRLL